MEFETQDGIAMADVHSLFNEGFNEGFIAGMRYAVEQLKHKTLAEVEEHIEGLEKEVNRDGTDND